MKDDMVDGKEWLEIGLSLGALLRQDDGLLQRRLFFPNFAAVCTRFGTVAAMSRSEAEAEIRATAITQRVHRVR